MYCNHCGSQSDDSARYCSGCGQPLSALSSPIASSAAPNTETAPIAPPVGPETEGKAVASLILGILSLTLFWIFAGIPAIILGHMSYSKIRKSMGRLTGEGMALAGLIMGYLSVAALPVILIIAAIAIPNLLRARTAANEASAVGSIRTINTAAATFEREFPDKGYPQTLEAMVEASGLPDATRAKSIISALAQGTRNGYRFDYSLVNYGDRRGYFVIAVPINPGSSGGRSFCADESAVIHVAQRNERCTSESPAL